jgi:hypothetical protein
LAFSVPVLGVEIGSEDENLIRTWDRLNFKELGAPRLVKA